MNIATACYIFEALKRWGGEGQPDFLFSSPPTISPSLPPPQSSPPTPLGAETPTAVRESWTRAPAC